MPVVVAVSGYKDSGKTTLCRKLLAGLQHMGVRTGYIKRASEENILSPHGTDSASVRDMGIPALLWGGDGLVMEEVLQDDVCLTTVAAKYFPTAELVILEGGKNLNLPKIWVRSEGEEALSCPGVFMIYDRQGASDGKRVFAEGDESLMAAGLLPLIRGSSYRSSSIYIGESQLPMKDFVADFIRGAVLGMISALKGGKNPAAPVRIYIDNDTGGKNIL